MKKACKLRSKGHKQCTTSTSASSQRPSTVDPLHTQTPCTQSNNKPAMESSIADLQKTFNEFSNLVGFKIDTIHADISTTMKKEMSEAAAEDNCARMLNIEKKKLPQMEKSCKMILMFSRKSY